MGNPTNPALTVNELSQIFLSEKMVRCRPSTYSGYEVIIKRHILPFFGDMSVYDIKPLLIRTWQNEILSKKLKMRYIRRIDTLLVSLFNYAVRFYELPNNPAISAGSIGQKPEKIVNFWTLDEFNQFIVNVRRPHLHTMYNTLYWTGMRIGELLALSPEDINMNEGYISVNRTFHKIGAKEYISPPKTQKGKRKIYIHPTLIAELQEYMDNFSVLFCNKPNTEPNALIRLFPFNPDYVRYHFVSIAARFGLKPIRIHDLRHSHASLLIELNVSPLLISERLGHEKVETTLEIYSHLYPNKQKNLAEALENISKHNNKTYS